MKKVFSLLLIIVLYISQPAFSFNQSFAEKSEIERAAEKVLKKQILAEAAWAMTQEPITVTASFCSRSAGGFLRPIIFGLILKILTGRT